MTLAELLAAFPERARRAFFAGVKKIQDQARVNEIVSALERGDIQRAIDALYLEGAAFREFRDVLEQGFSDAGTAQIEDLGALFDQNDNRFVFRFSARDLRAEGIIREHSSSLITRIVDDQKEAVRNALEEGLSRGGNPRATALNVVGRLDRRTRRRTGGIVGLSVPQERAVFAARNELQTGDYSQYLSRDRRDKRFDGIVRRAIKDGKPLTKEQVARITGRYSDRLLKLRGDTIARTETLTALNLGRYEAIEQLIETGKVDRQNVRLAWKATRDLRTRDTHRAMDGDSVAFGEEFVTPRGARMKYPGDPQGGPAEVINCRCTLRVRIDRRSNRG